MCLRYVNRIFSPNSVNSTWLNTSQKTLVLMKTASRRLDQDQFVRLGYMSSRHLQDVFQKCLQDIFKISWRRFEDVFKTSSRYLEDVLKTSSRHSQDDFKTSSRFLEDILTSKHLQDFHERCFQNVFKTYHQVKLFLLRRLQDVFTFLRRTAKTFIYRKICVGHTSDKFMVNVQNLEEW